MFSLWKRSLADRQILAHAQGCFRLYPGWWLTNISLNHSNDRATRQHFSKRVFMHSFIWGTKYLSEKYELEHLWANSSQQTLLDNLGLHLHHRKHPPVYFEMDSFQSVNRRNNMWAFLFWTLELHWTDQILQIRDPWLDLYCRPTMAYKGDSDQTSNHLERIDNPASDNR